MTKYLNGEELSDLDCPEEESNSSFVTFSTNGKRNTNDPLFIFKCREQKTVFDCDWGVSAASGFDL